MKLTISPDLYRAMELEATRTGRRLPEIVSEALKAWLAAAEIREDVVAAEEAMVEYRRDGGEAAEAFFRRLS